MGGGNWDSDSYKSTRSITSNTATSTGVSYKDAAFVYSNSVEARVDKRIHPSLDPKRINKKPFKKLESRDSEEHPESNAVLVCFDVTGSNYERAVEAQQKLSNLMEMLGKYLPDPQLAIGSNDDFKVEPQLSIQISDFESDNRVDNHIKNTILVGKGGANMGESYDLMLYAAGRKTVLDCLEKRQRKGYLFFYADEPFMNVVSREEVAAVFGDRLQDDISIKDMIKETGKMYNIFIIWPTNGYIEARDQYIKLFGKDRVLTLQDPNLICELIGSIIGINEERITDSDSAMKDLLALGTSKEDAAKILKTAATIRRKFKFDMDAAATGD